MAKRSNQKLKLLYLSKILLENTDERNAITMSQILKELEKYGVLAERKSIYDDIEALRIFGIDVQTTRDRYVRYYVTNRNFDVVDIKLFFDLLSASGLVGESKSRELLKKFNVPLPNELLTRTDSAVRRVNEGLYKNLSFICNAIYTDRKIRFKCYEFNSRKQKVVLLDGEYLIVNPLTLALKYGRYELMCFNESTNEHEVYDVGRIINLSVINVKRRANLPSAIKMDTHKTENVRLLCDNSVATEVFERFGLDVTVLANREQYFEISVKAEISPELFAWIFTYGGAIKISEPEWVRDEYSMLLKKQLFEENEAK